MENIGSRICFSTIFAGRLLALFFTILGFPVRSLGFSTLGLLAALAFGGAHRYYIIGGLVILALLLLCTLTTTILMWFKKPKLTLWITITQATEYQQIGYFRVGKFFDLKIVNLLINR
mgnify:CR=1 FL=1